MTNVRLHNANNEKTTTPWGGNTDDYSGAAFGMSVNVVDANANVIVRDSTFVSGRFNSFQNSDVGTLTSKNNNVTLTNFTGGWIDESSSKDILIIPVSETVVYTVDGNMATMKVSNISQSLSDIIGYFSLDDSLDLTIKGCGESLSTWTDFQFNFGEHGKPGKLHIQDITLSTTGRWIRCLFSRYPNYYEKCNY